MKKLAIIIAAILAIGAIALWVLPTRNGSDEECINENCENCEQCCKCAADEAPVSGTPLCGGYTEVREPSVEENQFFHEVADTVKGMTFTPLSVQTQVVAGTNYKFYCRYSDETEENNPGHCYLTIYKPLPGQGEPKVTAIEKIK